MEGQDELVNVCFITPEYMPIMGGIGSYVYYLSNILASNGNFVYIVTKGYSEGAKKKLCEKIWIFKLKTFKTPLLELILFYRLSSKKLIEISRRFSIDIAHVNLPLVPSFAVPKSLGKALVATVHSTWKGENEALKHESFLELNANEKIVRSCNHILRFFEYRLLKRSDEIIAVSKYTKKELLENYDLNANKINVIYNGVNVDKFKPSSNKDKIKKELGLNDDKIILYVGRLYCRKGLPTLLRAAPLILRKFKDVKFVISGKGFGSEEDRFRAFADRLKVGKNITFIGYFPDEKLPKLYQAADIFVLPSVYENLPFALLEAMATALPVITTNVGGIPEVIQDGKNGLLFNPFDFRGLADKVSYLLENPAFASEIGFSSRKTVEEKFDWRHIVKQVLKVYDKVLSKWSS
ncbi:MAG: glycosyltransferase family 4 protein [Candidatus Bathyarchaeia archaeon]